MRPDPAAVALAERYRLAVGAQPRGGAAGATRGRGTGSSVELEDRRDFQPGDDVRRVDWRAYGRSDRMLLKQLREEVRPSVDLVVDASLSISIEIEKQAVALGLAAMVAASARADGALVRVTRVGEAVGDVPVDALLSDGLVFDGRTPLVALLPAVMARLRPGAALVVVSDFLFPHDPAALVRGLGARAGRLGMVQVLGECDSVTDVTGMLQLIDVETGEARVLSLDAAARARYQARLDRLTAGLGEECRRLGAPFAVVQAEVGLATACRDALVPAGLLAVR